MEFNLYFWLIFKQIDREYYVKTGEKILIVINQIH